jgi:hypothetical protein
MAADAVYAKDARPGDPNQHGVEIVLKSRGRGLKLSETKTPPKWEGNLLAVYRLDGGKSENISAKVKAAEARGEGPYVVATMLRAGNSPWNANRCYVDLMYPGVTEKFLEVTMGAYEREIGSQFGQRVPGVFTDEPQLRPAGGMPWTDDLPQQFEKRWGYSLLDNLASLSQEVGDWKKVRHNYFQTVLALFIERSGEWPAYDRGRLDRERLGPERNGKQCRGGGDGPAGRTDGNRGGLRAVHEHRLARIARECRPHAGPP